MGLSKAFKIVKGDVVSFVGSGGKTTLIHNMADELIKSGNVLITTTTKMGIPSENHDDVVFLSNIDEIDNIDITNKIVIAGGKSLERKITSVDDEKFLKYNSFFDYILIESDGSKSLPYKAWRDHEPQIHDSTTKTVGIIPAHYYNRLLNEDLIFNVTGFKSDFGFSGILDFYVIQNIIFNKNGIFKDSIGDKYIYFNHCDVEDYDILYHLIDRLKNLDPSINYVYGSNFGEVKLWE